MREPASLHDAGGRLHRDHARRGRRHREHERRQRARQHRRQQPGHALVGQRRRGLDPASTSARRGRSRYVRIAVYNGNARQNRFDLQLSNDGTELDERPHDRLDRAAPRRRRRRSTSPTSTARYVRYVGHGKHRRHVQQRDRGQHLRAGRRRHADADADAHADADADRHADPDPAHPDRDPDRHARCRAGSAATTGSWRATAARRWSCRAPPPPNSANVFQWTYGGAGHATTNGSSRTSAAATTASSTGTAARR